MQSASQRSTLQLQGRRYTAPNQVGNSHVACWADYANATALPDWREDWPVDREAIKHRVWL